MLGLEEALEIRRVVRHNLHHMLQTVVEEKCIHEERVRLQRVDDVIIAAIAAVARQRVGWTEEGRGRREGIHCEARVEKGRVANNHWSSRRNSASSSSVNQASLLAVILRITSARDE